MEELQTFHQQLKLRIPVALEKLRKRPKHVESKHNCMGLLAGYIFALTGQRKGAITKLPVDEFRQCDIQDKTYVINVKDHKTAASHGRAKICLLAEEYNWLLTFATIRPMLPGYERKPRLLFFNAAGEEAMKIGDYVTEAWKACGFKGDITITDLRSSLSTHAERQLTPKDRQKVVKSMCHSTETANKYYVAERSVSEVYMARALLERAITIEDEEIELDDGGRQQRKAKGKKGKKRRTEGLRRDSEERGVQDKTVGKEVGDGDRQERKELSEEPKRDSEERGMEGKTAGKGVGDGDRERQKGRKERREGEKSQKKDSKERGMEGETAGKGVGDADRWQKKAKGKKRKKRRAEGPRRDSEERKVKDKTIGEEVGDGDRQERKAKGKKGKKRRTEEPRREVEKNIVGGDKDREESEDEDRQDRRKEELFQKPKRQFVMNVNECDTADEEVRDEDSQEIKELSEVTQERGGWKVKQLEKELETDRRERQK